MKHYIKTVRGISKAFISRSDVSYPQGSGQDGGTIVGNWQANNPMILAFQDLCQACTLASPDGRKKLTQWMVSFVNDNKLFMNFDPTTAVAQIYDDMCKGVKT